ncbi:hypothetical protein IEQ34_007400 [Dendrobium chrysotoxum]|uniref:Uncharacterized protein n=1 Tax=Dendrobium chrysotoxum TaxID=161865 RepID=A0AAV7HAA6_DENCH|nr:hypothetical protein IEQ34_007400 [Dendrobium chrysotoxum]
MVIFPKLEASGAYKADGVAVPKDGYGARLPGNTRSSPVKPPDLLLPSVGNEPRSGDPILREHPESASPTDPHKTRPAPVNLARLHPTSIAYFVLLLLVEQEQRER